MTLASGRNITVGRSDRQSCTEVEKQELVETIFLHDRVCLGDLLIKSTVFGVVSIIQFLLASSHFIHVSCEKKHAATVLCLSATFLMQGPLGVLQCNSNFCVKNTWNIRNSLTNTNLLYLKIYKWHNFHFQSEKKNNIFIYFSKYFYFPFWKQRLCHLYILGKVDLYF